jgi:hypothetical protein
VNDHISSRPFTSRRATRSEFLLDGGEMVKPSRQIDAPALSAFPYYLSSLDLGIRRACFLEYFVMIVP